MEKNKKFLILITLISCALTTAWTPLLPKDVIKMQKQIADNQAKIVKAYEKFLATDNPLAKALMPTLKASKNIVERAKGEEDPVVLEALQKQINMFNKIQMNILKKQIKVAKELKPGVQEVETTKIVAKKLPRYQKQEKTRLGKGDIKKRKQDIKTVEKKLATEFGFEKIDKTKKNVAKKIKSTQNFLGRLKKLLHKKVDQKYIKKVVKDLGDKEKKLAEAKIDLQQTKDKQQKNLTDLSESAQKLDTDIRTLEQKEAEEPNAIRKASLGEQIRSKNVALETTKKTILSVTEEVKEYDKLITRITETEEVVKAELGKREPVKEVIGVEKLTKGAQDLISKIEHARRKAQTIEKRARIIRTNEIPDIIIALMTEDPRERKALLEQLRSGGIKKNFEEAYLGFVLLMKTPTGLIIGPNIRASARTKKLKSKFLSVLKGNEKDLKKSRQDLHNIEKKLAVRESELQTRLGKIKEATPKAKVDAMVKKLNKEVVDSAKIRELVQKEEKETIKLIEETKKSVVLGNEAIAVLKRLIYKTITREKLERAIGGVAPANRFKKELQKISHMMNRSLPEPDKKKGIITILYVSLMDQLVPIEAAPVGNRAKANIASYLDSLERDFRDEAIGAKSALYGKAAVSPSLRRLELALGRPAPPAREEPQIPRVEQQIKRLIDDAHTTGVTSARAIAERISDNIQNSIIASLNELDPVITADRRRAVGIGRGLFGVAPPAVPALLPANLINRQDAVRRSILGTIDPPPPTPLTTDVIAHLTAQVTDLQNLRRHPAPGPQRAAIITRITNSQNRLLTGLDNLIATITQQRIDQNRVLTEFTAWKTTNVTIFDVARRGDARARSTTIISEMQVVAALINSYIGTIRDIKAKQGTVRDFIRVLE